MKTKTKFLAYFVSVVAIIAAVFACIFTSLDKEPNKINTTRTSYDLTNTVEESHMMFEIISDDEDNRTCKFIGLNSTPYGQTTLSIPEYVEISGHDYRVIEVDTEDSDASTGVFNNGDPVSSMYVYGSYITALVLPSSVNKINGGAFYGMASLQYLELKFPDTITSFALDGTTPSNYNLIIGKWPIHKLFAKGYYYLDEPGRYQEPYRLYGSSAADQIESITQQWYEMDGLQASSSLYFEMPRDLEKIVIKDTTELSNRSLFNLASLHEVELGNGLTNVGNYLFAGCDNLESVTLPSTLRTLSEGMFSECSSLTSIVLPKTTAIPENCFGGCTSLCDVVMSTSVKSIGNLAFAECPELRTRLYSGDDPNEASLSLEEAVVLPNGLETIGTQAFKGVLTIEKITIHNAVTKIGYAAFMDCLNIQHISLPFVGSVQGETSAPQGATEDEKLQYSNNFGHIFGKSNTIANSYGCDQLGASYRIPSKLRTINITNETILKPLSLGNLAYVDGTQVRTGVTAIYVNDSCHLDAGVFGGSNAIQDLSIPHIGTYSNQQDFGTLFAKPDGYTGSFNTGGSTATPQNTGTYYIPNSLATLTINNQEEIKTGAFKHCNDLVYVKIGKATRVIREAIFEDNQKLATLVLPFVGIGRGESRAYYWYEYWKEIYKRNSLAWVFSTEPSNQHYQDNTIAYYSSYRRYIPETLTTVEIFDEDEIDYRAFKNLYSITTLTISDEYNHLDHIESGAAEGCTGLTVLNLPYIGYDKNESGTDGDSHRAGYIFGTSSYTGYYASGYYIPSGLEIINVDYVSKITNSAFRNMSSLIKVSFKTSPSSIGDRAFEGCTKLSTFEYPQNTSFKKVGAYAFYGCLNVSSIGTVIPAYSSGSLELGAYSFGKTSIADIDFTKLSVVGDNCFTGCLNLTSVNVTSNIRTLGNGIFTDCVYLNDVTLADGMARKYMFMNCTSLEHIDLTTAIDDNVIPEGIFCGCTNLKWGAGNANVGVVFSDQITKIGAKAFYGCDGLERFVVPANVVEICDEALYGVNSLTSVVIPVGTTKIGNNVFTDTIGGDFVIWVYIIEDEWPWQSGWNCGNPVKVLPGDDDSIYDFVLNSTIKGYIITGIKPEYAGRLSGTLVIPSTHDGVNVIGVCNRILENQPNITKVVIPATFKALTNGAFNNGNRVDLYFAGTSDNAPKDYDTVNGTLGNIKYNTSETLRDIIAAGLVFFGGDWVSDNHLTPYVLASKITFGVDDNNIVYNNTAWTPAVESAVLPGIAVVNDNITNITKNINPSVFDYAYSDNINAGNARVDASINEARYNTYVRDSGVNSVLLTGSANFRFTIQKQLLMAYYNPDTIVTSFDDVVYHEGRYFTNNIWTNQNVEGLEALGVGYSMTGTISTRSDQAGLYAIFGEESNSDFYWASSWTIRYRGRDVTQNFRMAVFLEVEIQKMKVYLDWTGGTIDDDGYYAYPYNGQDQLATAAAFYSADNGDSETNLIDTLVEECAVTVRKVGNIRTKYPYDVNATGDTPTDAPAQAYAYLTNSAMSNYELVGGVFVDGNTEGIICTYYITKADVTLQIRDSAYLIPYDADNYSFDASTSPYRYVDSDNGITRLYDVKGLAEGSKISGEVISRAYGDYAANDRVTYNYDNGGITWKNKLYNFDITYHGLNVHNLPYLIAKYDDEGNIIEIENDYYNLPKLDVEITIVYHEFEVEFWVGDTKLDVSGEYPIYNATYHTDGVSRPLTIKVVNDGLDPITIESLTYSYQGSNGETNIPKQILAVDNYSVVSKITRKNFETHNSTIYLNVVKSPIEYRSLDKEYDGENVDLSTFITKKGVDQIVELTLCDANHNVIPSGVAINPGTYSVYVVASSTDYFEPFDGYVDFVISKRVIHIYVDRGQTGYLNENATYDAQLEWTGSKYAIMINTENLDPADKFFLVGNDNLYGALYTKSSKPGVYDTAEPGDWYWSPSWSVYDGMSGANKANVYYTVELHGTFTILHKTMNVAHTGVTTDYDGNFYSSTITVTEPSVGYTIYYSDSEPSVYEDEETKQLMDDHNGWRRINYTYQAPGSYQVWFKVVYDNYLTEYGSDLIEINYVPITYDMPSVFNIDVDQLYINYSGLPTRVELENVVPMGALVEYQMGSDEYTSTPYVLTSMGDYVIRYRINYPNYEEVTGSYSFRITEDYLTSLSGYVYADDVEVNYDGMNHGLDVVVTHPDLIQSDPNEALRYTVYYRVVGSVGEWSSTRIAFTDAGEYRVEYLVVAYDRGFKSYQSSAIIKINPLVITGITVDHYIADYDGDYHGLEISGVDDYPGMQVYYTTNADIGAQADVDVEMGGWQTDPIEYKNVGTYQVYVAFVCRNYETKIVSQNIIISKATPAINYTDGYEVEYLGRRVTIADIGVETVHDGTPTVKYYDAVVVNNVYVISSTTPIQAPSRIGHYYVTIDYANTDNCYGGASAHVEFGFDIVKKRLVVQYDDHVEYTGEEQGPNPTVDSGTGDHLSISMERYNSDELPTDIGVYHFNFFFTTPQESYELVVPEDDDGYPAYPYRFEITKIDLRIEIEAYKSYDYEERTVWYKDSAWEAYDFYDRILTGHEFVATMYTNSYARGTYVYDSSSEQVVLNRVIVNDAKIINSITGEEIVDIYDLSFNIVVHIVYEDLDVTCEDRIVIYDGEAHGLEITVNNASRGLVYSYASEEDYAQGIWRSSRVTYVNQGEYRIYFMIQSPSHETYIGSSKLTIRKASLIIDINDFDETYDAYPHSVSFSITNANNIESMYSKVRYYKVDEFDFNYLDMAYSEYNEESTILDEGLTEMIEAGDYYAVVFFEDEDGTYNYYNSYTIEVVTLKQRQIRITLTNQYIRSFDYDGNKKGIALGAATVNTGDLVYGHRIPGNQTAASFIQTISPNSATGGNGRTYYGETDFEFLISPTQTIIIRDASGNDVTKNYKPWVSNDQLQITILQIPLLNFSAEDLTREYNGLPANPTVISDNKDGEITYTYFLTDSLGNPTTTTVPAAYATGIGRYYVVCDQGEGTNYLPWTGSSVGAYVTITPCNAVVQWDNLTTVFDATYQSPDAYIIDVFGERLPINVELMYGGKLEPSVIKVGVYQVVASLDDENYNISNYVNIYTINKLEFILEFNEVTDDSSTEWTKTYTKDDFQNFPEVVSLAGLNKQGLLTVQTNDKAPGLYESGQFSVHYTAWYDYYDSNNVLQTIDLTDSFKFTVNGTVYINSKLVLFDYDDAGVKYSCLDYDSYTIERVFSGSDEDELAISDFISVTVPRYQGYSIRYLPSGAPSYVDESPSYTNVGQYIVDFTIIASDSSYTSNSGTIILKIVPKESTITFSGSISKPYDGLEIDDDTVKAVISGEWNGNNKTSLELTYYEAESAVPLTHAPINAGKYRVEITNSADDPNAEQNYTTLNVSRYFEITAKTITLTKEFDVEVSDATMQSSWTSGVQTVVNQTVTGLGPYNTLKYEIATSANRIQRGLYKINSLVVYNPLDSTSVHVAESTVMGVEFVFDWSVTYNKTQDANNDVDSSFNYNIQVNIIVKFHYPYMTVNALNDITFDYDGNPHYGDDSNVIIIPANPLTLNLVKEYGDSATTVSSSNSISTFAGTIPGSYTTHYRYTCDGYEPYEGSYTVTIEYADRDVTVDYSSFNKEYNGLPVGQINGNGYYLPQYTINPIAGMPEDVDLSTITVWYYSTTRNQTIPYQSVVDADRYRFVMTIPQSTYYKETIIEREFTISKKVIYVDGEYEVGYRNSNVYYYDFGTPTSAFDLTFTGGLPVPSTFTFSNCTIMTTSAAAGTYRASSSQVLFSTSPIIRNNGVDVTKNYQMLLHSQQEDTNTIITIKKGVMSVEIWQKTKQYDGTPETIEFNVSSPQGGGYTITYCDTYDGVYQTEKIYRTNVGTYTIYFKITPNLNSAVSYNYEEFEGQATLTITQAQSVLTIPNLSKYYDGQYVTPPSNISLNHSEIQVGNLTPEFQVKIDDVWTDISAGNYPKNAGEYRIKYIVPSTTNYHGCEEIKEFRIEGIVTTVNWGTTTFIYNGDVQKPTASFAVLGTDVVNPVYTILDSQNNQVDPKNIGTYTIRMTLDSVNQENYIFDESQLSTIFQIIPRDVTIRLNASRTYDGTYFEFTNSDFTAQNIVTGHTVQATLKLRDNIPGSRSSEHFEDNFTWLSTNPGYPVIVNGNEANTDVTSNYNILYDVRVNVTTSSITYSIENYSGEYDGLPHAINVIIDDLESYTPNQPVIEYSLTPGGPYSADNKIFTNVVNMQAVYVRITCPGYTSINGEDNPDSTVCGYVNITKKNAGLRLTDQFLTLDKYYDALPVNNPGMTYADMDSEVGSRYLTWTYYRKNTDVNSQNYGLYEVKNSTTDISNVQNNPKQNGEYKLVVTLSGGDNYLNGTFEREFIIRKRTITIYNTQSFITVPYSGNWWQTNITEGMYDVASVNVSSTSQGLVSGEQITGTVNTRSANVGRYNSPEQFRIQGLTITNNGTVVTGNYNIELDMDIEITLKDMTVDSSDVLTTYDGLQHAITVQPIDPATGYIIYYAEADDDALYSTNEIYKTSAGEYTIYYKVVAPNYNDKYGHAKITIEGLDSTTGSTIIAPSGTLYYGDAVPDPYYRGPSVGTQHVTYYYTSDSERQNPMNTLPRSASGYVLVGTYIYVLTVESDGIYSTATYPGTITVNKLAIEVDWGDLEFEYNGQNQKPSPTITTLEDTDLALEVDQSYAKTNVGTYQVSVTYDNSNYLLTNNNTTFEITKKEIAIPNIKPDMNFVYRFEIKNQVYDENGDPVLDEDDNPTYTTYIFGDEIIITDVDGNIYVLDEDGNILRILNPDNTVLNANPNLEYRLVIDSNLNACEDGEYRELSIQIIDTVNYCWADVENKDANQVVQYTISKYSLPNSTDGTSASATLDAYAFTYTEEDGVPQEQRPEPTVVLKKDGVVIYTFTPNQYALEYTNNVRVSTDSSKANVNIKGIGNFDFEIDKEFIIQEAAPEMFGLVPGAIPIFMKVTYENIIKTYEAGEYDRNEEISNASPAEVEAVKSSFYLGHIHHRTKISTILSQFTNNRSLIKVFKISGEEIPESRWDLDYVGTGTVFKLYKEDDPTQEIDSIEAIVYGDVDGDGTISAVDAIIYGLVLANKFKVADLQSGACMDNPDYVSNNFISMACYYAMMLDRSEGNEKPSAPMLINLRLLIANKGTNFNAEYEIIE